MNLNKTLFAQVMEYVPWEIFERIIKRHKGDVGTRTLKCTEVFRVMAFAQLTWRESLRDIEICLNAHHKKLFHMGIRNPPARSTLADALNKRNWQIYYELAMKLIVRARDMYTDEPNGTDVDASLYALDSTTIDLCLTLFEWASFRTTKAAIKLHTLLDLRGPIPAFIYISDGKMADVKVLDFLPVEAGAFYIMDRGYIDFARLYKLHKQGAFFVIREKRRMKFRRRYSSPVDKISGVMCDQIIVLTGVSTDKGYSEVLRRIRYTDPESKKRLVFITNNMTLPAITIALLYKRRWDVELFFKWIKQNLRIKRFLGTSENAVKTQIWCAVATYALIAIIKKQLKLETPLYNFLQFLSVSIFDKTLITQALQPEDGFSTQPEECNQLNLLGF